MAGGDESRGGGVATGSGGDNRRTVGRRPKVTEAQKSIITAAYAHLHTARRDFKSLGDRLGVSFSTIRRYRNGGNSNG